MSGNRAIYDRAMEQSREAARLKRWDDAVKNAALAVREFPQDTDARTAAGVALFHTGKFAQALQVLQELHADAPDSTFYLDYIARSHEGQGNAQAALEIYEKLLKLHEQRRSTSAMIVALRDMLRLRPDLDEQRAYLARLLTETRAPREAAVEYLTLARRCHEREQLDDAAQHAETALRLDPDSREAKELLMLLRGDMATAAGLPRPDDSTDEISGHSGGLPTISGDLRSQQFALEKIVATALEKQEEGDIPGAIQAYEEVINAGLERADVFYSLGLLYQQQGDAQAAVNVLSRAASDPEYALSAHFALGSTYTELNQLPQAAQEFENAIGMVDLASVGKAESEDLIQMYEQVTDIYQQMGDLARAASLYSTLATFLSSKRWGREKGEEFTRRAKELTDRNMMAKLRSLGTGTLSPADETQPDPEPAPPEEQVSEKWGKITPIIDFLQSDNVDVSTGLLDASDATRPPSEALDAFDTIPPSDTLVSMPVTPLDTSGLDEQSERWVTASERYIEQGLLDAAMDACHEVMYLDIGYLPIHLRIGEIYERQGLTEEALAKYQALIDLYTVRGEQKRAIDVYFRYIHLSPDTLNARTRLAELLKGANRIQEATEQIRYVADAYLRLGQNNRALEEYRRGLQWDPKDRTLRSQYGVALFKLGRFEAALSEFHKATDPDDPISIAHINMTLGMLGEQPNTIWDSLASIIEKITAHPELGGPVQAEYRTALIYTDDPLLHYILGIIQQNSKQHSSALLEFEQAQAQLDTEPHDLLPMALVHQAMASSYIELEQPAEALEQLRLARKHPDRGAAGEQSPHSFARPLSEGEVIWHMAEAYAAADDLENAEKSLREALRYMPYNKNIYNKLANVSFRQGKLGEALSTLEDLATYYENRQDLDSAIETLEYALKLGPGSISIVGRLARLYIRRGYPDKGVDGLVRVADLQRRDGQIKDAISSLQQAAEIRWMQSQHEETLAIYDRIVSIAPNDVEARQWRAIMYTLVARTDEAVAEKKAIANILAERKDYDNAIAELHQIIGINQNDVEAYFMLGDMLMRRGEYAQALSLYNRLKRMEQVEADRVEALIAAANRMLQNQQMTS